MRRPQRKDEQHAPSGFFDFDDPRGYVAWVREQLPDYDDLQRELVAATQAVAASRILDLGTGSGETARRALEAHPGAHLVGIDASEEMIGLASRTLADHRVTLHVAALEDPLPAGPFDLVVSALSIHHLDAPGKADLYHRVACVLDSTGRFVVADLVGLGEPLRPLATKVPGDPHSSIAQQLRWLRDAGLHARITWEQSSLVVIAADRTGL